MIGVLFASGFTIIQPNEARVVTFFGSLCRRAAQERFSLHRSVQFQDARAAEADQLRHRSSQSQRPQRQSDRDRRCRRLANVTDAAQASVQHRRLQDLFVANQSDIAIRTLAAHYPYDSRNRRRRCAATSARSPRQFYSCFREASWAVAGIHVEETRLSHLAYASEIAGAHAQAPAGGGHLPGAPLRWSRMRWPSSAR